MQSAMLGKFGRARVQGDFIKHIKGLKAYKRSSMQGKTNRHFEVWCKCKLIPLTVVKYQHL